MIAAPFAATVFPRGLLTLILVTFVFGLGIWAMWKNPRVRFAAFALAIPAVIAWSIDIVDPSNLAVRVLMAFTALFFGLAIARVFIRIERLEVVNEDSFYGAGSIYLMIGLGYSVVYYTAWKILPDTFYSSLPAAVSKLSGWHDFVYFSFTTLATVGYGDITPVGPFVRSLAILEVISGVFFVAVIIARLVSLYRR